MRYLREKDPNCPLGHGDRTQVCGEGDINALVAFVGEAPGRDEDRTGRPFVGAAGGMFETGLGRAGIRRESCWITNVLCCFSGDTFVESRDLKAVYRRWYDGSWISAKTPSGVLSGTPNHPVLTLRGWVGLGSLLEGDYLLRGAFVEGMPSGNPHVEDPTRLEDLFGTLSKAGIGRRVVGRDVDFHGDGSESEVDVVSADYLLRTGFKPSLSQESSQLILEAAYEAARTLDRLSTSPHALLDLIRGLFPSASGPVGWIEHALAVLYAGRGPTKGHGLALTSNRNSELSKQPTEEGFATVEIARKWLESFPVEVSTEKVLSVDVGRFSGHVYNLHTRSERYLADGYIVHNCRPTNNQIGHPDAQEAIGCCGLGNLERELSRLGRLRVVVTLGNTATQAVLGDPNLKISAVRGSVYEHRIGDRKLYVIPMLHPAALLYLKDDDAGAENVTRSFWAQKAIWDADLSKVARISREGWSPPARRFNLHPTLSDVRAFVKRWEGHDLGCDTETTSLSPRRGKIFCLSLAPDGERALCVPFYKQGGGSYWTPDAEQEVRTLLKQLFASSKLVFQNAMFDVPWLEKEIGPVQVADDVMLLHHAISPEMPHNLGHIVSMYGETPYWKDVFIGRAGRIQDMPDEDLRQYNCDDTVVLQQIRGPLREDAKEMGVLDVYELISLQLVRPVIHMSESGLLLSKSRLEKWTNELEQNYRALESKLRLDGALRDAWNPDSDDDVRLFLFRDRAPKYARARSQLDDRISRELKTNTKVHQNLVALVRVSEETQPLVELKGFQYARTKGGKIQVDKKTRLRLYIHINNRLADLEAQSTTDARREEEADGLRRLRDWLRTFDEYKKTGKLISTYTKYETDADGRIRPSYKIHGTATGRLASSGPNAQNIPKEARHIFVPEKGKVFLSADYSNLELRLAAYITGDQPLIDVFESGRNVHDENTVDLFGISPEHPDWDSVRRAAKVYIFGRNYGGGLRGIYERVAMDAPDLGLTYARFVQVDAAYRSAHPRYSAWFDQIAEEVVRKRSLRNLFGRVRHFLGPDYAVRMEGVNFPIQSAAADLINKALVVLYSYVRGQDDVRIVAQIHDALLLEVDERLVDETAHIVRKVMELGVKIGKYNVKFPVDVSVGKDWYHLEELKVAAPQAVS